MSSADQYDAFLAAQAKDDYPPPPDMLSAFEELFKSSSTPMSMIAKNAVSPIIANLPNEQDPRWPDCTLLWRTLKEAVDKFTEHNDKFVDLIVELQKLPDGDHVFKILPQFREHWTEFGNTMAYWPSETEDRDAKRQAQMNQHAFLAKLSTYKVPEIDQIGRVGFVMRSTCEFAPWEKVHFPDIEEYYDFVDEKDWPATRDRELERVSIKILNDKISYAAQWIRLVGERMYEMEGKLDNEHDWQNNALNCKWTASKGWSKQRFVFWRERLEWMTTITALEKSTQNVARECADRMREIEGTDH